MTVTISFVFASDRRTTLTTVIVTVTTVPAALVSAAYRICVSVYVCVCERVCSCTCV